jgi:hypothetical protein
VLRPGGVLFIALEGQDEVDIRLQAQINERGGGKPDRMPFVWTEDCPPLLAKNAVDELAKRAAHVAAEMRKNWDMPLALIVIDTMVVAAGYTKEGSDNDTSTTSMTMGVLAKLARRARCFCFGIDHFGKNPEVGTRGNSAKEGNADVILALLANKAITGEVSQMQLAVRKRRGAACGLVFPFTTRVVDMGVNERGKKQTTLFLDWGTAALCGSTSAGCG